MYRNRTAAQFFLLGSILALRLYAAEPAASPGIGVAEAIRMMLDQDPNLTIEESRLRSSRGILLSTRGAFDPVVSTSLSEREVEDPLSESTSRQQSILTNRLGVTKRYRTGFSIEPDLQLTRTAGSDPGAVNLGTVALTLRQPLLRGRGRAATAAPELSAERQVAASELDLRQTTSERALTVIAQYWQARAGHLNLEILEESEARARDLLETTRKLIEADVTPAADLVQVEANVVAKETARIGGERDLFEARQALGREIGLPPESIATLPVPVDRFPIVSASAVPSTADHSRWVARAPECGRAPAEGRGKRPQAPARPGVHPELHGSGAGVGRRHLLLTSLQQRPGRRLGLVALPVVADAEQPGAGRPGPVRGRPGAKRPLRGASLPADRGERPDRPRRGGP